MSEFVISHHPQLLHLIIYCEMLMNVARMKNLFCKRLHYWLYIHMIFFFSWSLLLAHVEFVNLIIKQTGLLYKNRVLWRMVSSGMLRHVALVRTNISEELSASFIRVTRIGELTRLQESHGVTSQKTPFFIVTAMKTSNLTQSTHLKKKMCLLWQRSNNLLHDSRSTEWGSLLHAAFAFTLPTQNFITDYCK
jgi:hypothetical protein